MEMVRERTSSWKYYCLNLSEYVKISKEIEKFFRKLETLSLEIWLRFRLTQAAHRLDKARVEKLVRKYRKYDHITGAGFSKLDELLSFMHGVGIYDLIDSIHFTLKRKPDIPRSFIHLALALRPILEITRINQDHHIRLELSNF